MNKSINCTYSTFVLSWDFQIFVYIMMDRVYFVFATFEKHPEEMGMGVWEPYLPGVCAEMKKGGRRSTMFYDNYGHVTKLRVVEREWAEPEDPQSEPIVFSENTYSQQDMEIISLRT